MPVYRFVHAFDLVTTVPLEEMEYRHVGDILHIEGGDADQVTRQPQHSLVAALLHNLAVFPKNAHEALKQIVLRRKFSLPDLPMPDDALVDHAPMNYTRKLGSAASASRNLP